ncbi:MAG TPA: adenosylcobinamide-GDP ribazoletransferase [Nostocaceae cyanobacterium]|nr:adenosylcobinamide-GDP ribazoletransferase [Nostocaceae cyanobacterium]
MTKIFLWVQQQILQLIAAIIFYTAIPLPYIPNLDFQRVAYFAPLVGVIIGGILGLGDTLLNYLSVPLLTRSALIVAGGIIITGGLHLDGAMDTADGLAVTDPEKRLQVMVDSATGAFGAMAAITIVLLKTAALSDFSGNHWLVLMAACGWGRWGQQIAILCYPYLKATGKGAIHKGAIRSYVDVLPGFLILICLSVFYWLIDFQNLVLAIVMSSAGSAIACCTAAWFNYKLGGHTGDTYGAVVEWTETIFLCVMTMI